MGFMTKGFLAFLLPVLIALPYMIWQRRLTEMMRYGLLAVLVAVLVSLPWVLTVHMREPDFWSFFFWHEHIRRFAGDDAQHAQPWWFYLPLLIVSSLPWALALPGTFKHAWQTKSQPKIAFLLLWLVLPLAFFSLSRGKLPTYIMPCLLPLALLIGHTLTGWLEQARTGIIRANGLLNLALGLITLLTVTYLQFKQPIYDNEPLHLTFVLIALGIWSIANALQVARPSTLFLAPAVGMLALVALLPAALPNTIIYNKTPDVFISEHAQALRETRSLLSNELGAASALAWHTARPDITLYNTVGETQYGFTYPDAKGRAVTLSTVQQWMTQARQKGSVGVVMRVKDDGERHEVDLLPKDGKRYEQGNIVIFIFAQTTP